MAKHRRIKARVEINLSQDHLGLTRIFSELTQIEDENHLATPDEINMLKRRYMLSILYQYAASEETPIKTGLISAAVVASDRQLTFNSSRNSSSTKSLVILKNDANGPPDYQPTAMTSPTPASSTEIIDSAASAESKANAINQSISDALNLNFQ